VSSGGGDPMKKLILNCGLSPGDIVMLTAAVRDLHRAYPGEFITDVRTLCPELWEHNPHLTPLLETDAGVEVIDCSYPLIDESNRLPYHCLHGFIEFLNARLGLRVQPTLFKGDIHLSEQEKAWFSQVHELAGQRVPFWLVAAGGKRDVTIKWWETARFQAVVDHFAGRIQFVQVGGWGDHHPRLNGVIDLRGQTTLRELVRLVYHADGALCPVTALMHLAAAVEVKGRPVRNRPCVVIAGGREPAHWEAYPDHYFLHTNGALACCLEGGCWRDRTAPLGDGDKRDRPESLCVDVVGALPRCMAMITPADVIRGIENYYVGGVLKALTPRQAKAGLRAQLATAQNPFDRQPLTLEQARVACARFIPTISAPPPNLAGRGIVMCAGGVRYFTNAWVGVNMLRRLGCSLPIEFWHLGEEELDDAMGALVAPLGVELRDATAAGLNSSPTPLGGWELKPYAILHSRFREVLFLDADNLPVVNPEFLFETPQFKACGAIFWPDYGRLRKTSVIWRHLGLRRPPGPEFESGQIVVDKKRCWRALSFCLWLNEHSDLYYKYLHGDKETFHLAFKKLNQPFALIPTPIHTLPGTMCQHDFDGRRLFQHRNTDKWDLFLRNRIVPDFWFEAECRALVEELRRRWDGRSGRYWPAGVNAREVRRRRPSRHPSLRIQTCMISCAERGRIRRQTLRNLAATDWGDAPVMVQLDRGEFRSRRERQTHTAWLALAAGAQGDAEYLLFLEDDLEFNRSLRHNLERWEPLRRREVTLAGLYNPGVPALAHDVPRHASIVSCNSIFGSQAFLISVAAARFMVRRWHEVSGMQDIRIARLAGLLEAPIFYHVPSLVQHVGKRSVWGGKFHQAKDFDPEWRA